MERFALGQTVRRSLRQRVKHGNSQHLSLIDVLHLAPRVLELITPGGKKALLAVCTSSRLLIHAFASSIHLKENDTLECFLATVVGPRLRQLMLEEIRLTVVAVVGLTRAPWASLTNLTLVNCRLDASAIRKLAEGKWPLLQDFSVRKNSLSRLEFKAMAGMETNWPLLRNLDLSCNGLGAIAMSHLTQLSWTRIRMLDLSYNPKLDAKAVEKLASGSWPCLKSLAIHGTFGLKYFVQVAASCWPLLETVAVKCAYSPPRAVSFAGFAPNARNVQIVTFEHPCTCPQGTFGMPALSELIQLPWHNLQSLDLSRSNLGGDGLRQLAGGQWPLLSMLDVSCEISAQHFTSATSIYARFAQGSWPRLSYLSLAGHGMNDDCAAELINADWPKLQTLDLSYNRITCDGRARLTLGNWPGLQNLWTFSKPA